MTNREKFIEAFGDNPQRHHITKSWWDEEYVPSQEPKTEHWIRKSYLIPIKTKEPSTVVNGIFREVTTTCKYRYTYTCSKCGGNEYFEKYSYCPQCGAKMESEDKENG